MTDRRDFLIGGGCAVALGLAEYLRPRRIVELLGQTRLDTAVPRVVGKWSAEMGGDFVVPQREGSLADRLYSEQVMRNYRLDANTPPIMLVIAYGRSQSDDLQLHRPESCYPAVGFSIAERHLIDLPLRPGAALPSVAMTAVAEERVEDIVYWTRVGEYLPQTAGQQRRDRLKTSLDGYIGDGVLVRASMIRPGPLPEHAQVERFLTAMVSAMQPAVRPAFIGTALARQLA
jgi:EpsI family protein